MKKATIAFVFAALSVGTMGCNKSKADTANPEEVKPADPTPPAETPPADGEGAPDPAGDSQEAESGAATAPTGESEPPQTPEEAHEVLVTATGAPPAPPEDEPRFPNGRDPVAEAAAFVAAKGGDTDGPAADPESVGDFDYDADDDDEPEPGD